jgi:hypothetical protein
MGQSGHELLDQCRAMGEKRIGPHGVDGKWAGCGGKRLVGCGERLGQLADWDEREKE